MKNDLLIKELGKAIKNGTSTWAKQTEIYNTQTGNNISSEAFRKQYSRISINSTQEPLTNEFTTLYGDGTVEAQKIVNLSPAQKNDQREMLKAVGYNPDEWEIISLTFSNWQQHTKEQETKELYSVRFKIKPLIKTEINVMEALEETKTLFSSEIKPLKLNETKNNKELNENKLFELPAIELHLGKLSCQMDTGENYDQHIAQYRFRNIMSGVVAKQKQEQCGTLLLSIGNDFFNSDTSQDTTNKGTQQHSDVRYRKMFLTGLKLYTEALLELEKHFNKIDIQLVSGNHDLTTSFYLYIALSQGFMNSNKINFKEDYKEVQCYTFGDCGIWQTHGTRNVNRTMDSIVAEFPIEYGQTKYRELHLNHLHQEQELKERLGIIPRRLSSPTGKDEWEYNERFGKNIQKQQLFIWEKGIGLIDIKMIPFEPAQEELKKKLIRR